MAIKSKSPTTDALRLRMAVATNTRRLRHAKGLTQVDFAHASGIERTYVSRLESGKFDVGLDMLSRLASALGVEPAELLEQPKHKKHLGVVEAANEQSAIEKAAKQFDIPPERPNRITVEKLSKSKG